MSMLFSLRRVSQEEASKLKKEPAEVVFFLLGKEVQAYKKSFLDRIFSRKSPSVKRSWTPPAEHEVLHLGKYWHILHYVLSGSAWEGQLPQSMLLVGGEDIGDVSVGYGPARLIGLDELSKFYRFLLTLDKESFGQSITTDEILKNELYCYGWSVDDRRVLWGYIEKLKDFLASASANKELVVAYLY